MTPPASAARASQPEAMLVQCPPDERVGIQGTDEFDLRRPAAGRCPPTRTGMPLSCAARWRSSATHGEPLRWWFQASRTVQGAGRRGPRLAGLAERPRLGDNGPQAMGLADETVAQAADGPYHAPSVEERRLAIP